MIEQRKNQRFDLRLPFEIIRGSAVLKSEKKAVGETKNVSSSGVLFTSDALVEVGEPIEYFITFPKPRGTKAEVKLKCMGKVLRNDPEETFAATLERYEFVRA